MTSKNHPGQYKNYIREKQGNGLETGIYFKAISGYLDWI